MALYKYDCIDIFGENYLSILSGSGGVGRRGKGGVERRAQAPLSQGALFDGAVNSRRFDISDAVGLPRLDCAHFISQSVNRKTLRPRDIVPPCY